MNDLFEIKKSHKDKLLDFIKEKKYVKTSEIIAWGCRNFSNRADRDARLLAQEGKIKRMNKQKKISYFGNISEDVYELVGWSNNFKIS